MRETINGIDEIAQLFLPELDIACLENAAAGIALEIVQLGPELVSASSVAFSQLNLERGLFGRCLEMSGACRGSKTRD